MTQLTNHSIAGGCGCKIPAESLKDLLNFKNEPIQSSNIICGLKEKDDAVIYEAKNEDTFVQSLDFFSPIVDDAYTFGKIAAANSISDIYAKGGVPFLALSILGYPIETVSTSIANEIVQGAIDVCNSLSISLAGGHSIKNPQIIFGLSVTGSINRQNIKSKSDAKNRDWLYLTKPLGIGIYSTAIKRKLFRQNDYKEFLDVILKINKLGLAFSQLGFVNAMTDVTGFGLIGHLVEICEQSNKSAELYYENIITLNNINHYVNQGVESNGGQKNAEIFAPFVSNLNEAQKRILSDPQTNGGLLITVSENEKNRFEQFLSDNGLENMARPIGQIRENESKRINIEIVK